MLASLVSLRPLGGLVSHVLPMFSTPLILIVFLHPLPQGSPISDGRENMKTCNLDPLCITCCRSLQQLPSAARGRRWWRLDNIPIYKYSRVALVLWELLQPTAFKILGIWMQTKSVHCSLGYWILFQYLMHTEDFRSLLLLWVNPHINKALLYSVPGYGGTL